MREYEYKSIHFLKILTTDMQFICSILFVPLSIPIPYNLLKGCALEVFILVAWNLEHIFS